jgi:hypothetical protein
MPKRIAISLFIWCIAWMLCAELAHAQIFGSRRMGQPLSRRPGPAASATIDDAGTLTGTERFLRENRRPTDFVGPDLRELQRFIGILQATARGRVTPITEGIRRRIDRSATMNQPIRTPQRNEMYFPQLEISFPAPHLPKSTLEQSALETLARSPQMSGASRIEVLVEDRIAILQGEVPSEADRDLAAILLSFEPGISTIDNRLRVVPDLAAGENSLDAFRAAHAPRQAWTTMSQAAGSATRQQQGTSRTGRSY